MELGGGGGIRNHDEQHVSVFDSLCVQLLSHTMPTYTLQVVADVVCAVVGSSVKSTDRMLEVGYVTTTDDT